jgi:hypothetical protein
MASLNKVSLIVAVVNVEKRVAHVAPGALIRFYIQPAILYRRRLITTNLSSHF